MHISVEEFCLLNLSPWEDNIEAIAIIHPGFHPVPKCPRHSDDTTKLEKETVHTLLVWPLRLARIHSYRHGFWLQTDLQANRLTDRLTDTDILTDALTDRVRNSLPQSFAPGGHDNENNYYFYIYLQVYQSSEWPEIVVANVSQFTLKTYVSEII